MKSFIVFALLVAAAVAAPTGDGDAQILNQAANPNTGDGSYDNQFQTSNGISASEQGQLTNQGTENEGISVRGQFSYTGVDGQVYTVEYIADQNGFQPQAAHIPK